MVNKEYLRNVVFGFEDGFVSTVGALVGIAASNPGREFILISGLIVISVEAFSMGVGSYLSEKTAHEASSKGHSDGLIIDGVLMWLSYFIAGLLVLSPFLIIQNPSSASIPALAVSLAGLFVVGFVKGKMVKVNALKSGFEMMIIAGVAALLGYGVSILAQRFL